MPHPTTHPTKASVQGVHSVPQFPPTYEAWKRGRVSSTPHTHTHTTLTVKPSPILVRGPSMRGRAPAGEGRDPAREKTIDRGKNTPYSAQYPSSGVR